MTEAETGLTVRFERTGRLLSQESRAIIDWSIDTDYRTSTDEFSFTLFSDDPELTADSLLLEPVELIVNGASQLLGRIEVTEIGDNGTAVRCSGRDYLSELVECNVDPSKMFAEDTALGAALLDVMGLVGIRTVTDFENVSLTSIRSGLKLKPSPAKKKPSLESQQKASRGPSVASALANPGASGSGKAPPTPPRQRVNPISDKIKEFHPKPGQGIYECANRLCARFGVTIQPSVKRSEICLDAPDYAAAPLFKLMRTKDPTQSAGNNIVRGTARRDYSRFPTYSVFTGTASGKGKQGTGLGFQFSTLEFAKALGLDELSAILERSSQVGRSKDGDPNVLYRLLYHRDEDSKTQEQLDLAARRAMADRLRDTLTYPCTVKGHVDPVSGGVWSVGAMVEVSDEVARVFETLWIAKRTLRYAPGEGAMTDLELIRPGTWAINEEV